MRKYFIVLLTLTVTVIGLQIVQLSSSNPEPKLTDDFTLLNDLFLLSLSNSGLLLNDIEVYDGKSSEEYLFFSAIEEECLVFRFSGEACDVCIDFVITQLKEVFPDFSYNNRIILVGSNLNRRVLENYYDKNVQYIKNDYFNMPGEEYYLPCLFIVGKSRISKQAFIPEKSYSGLTKEYLLMIRSRYFED